MSVQSVNLMQGYQSIQLFSCMAIRALPMVAATTVQGGAGFKDATRTMKMQNFIPG